VTRLKDKDSDLLIKRAIQSEMKSSPPPLPIDEAWKQLETKLNEQRPSPSRSPFYKSKLFYAVAILFISLIILFSPQSSGAYSTIVEVFQKVQENVTQLFIKVEDDIGPPSDEVPPPDDMFVTDGDMISLELSFEDAQDETQFIIKQPKVVPKGYTLKNVTVFKSKNKESKDITLNYEASEGNFNINQRLLGESYSAGVTIDNDDAQIDTIDIYGQSGSLLQHKDHLLELIWVSGDHHYSISGTLLKEEIIEIAKSM
jgi:hypothetical protein